MRWQGRRESDNVEDRRSMGGAKRIGLGGGVLTIFVALLAIYLGADPMAVMQDVVQEQPAQQGVAVDPNDEMSRFVSVVLADTEEVWKELFRRQGQQYRVPKLVIFSGSVDSACGFQSAATGPFYCPLDEKVYIDLTFYDDLKTRFDAPGDFAQAYVIAHEVGHHVQNLLGISQRAQSMRRQLSETEYNELSVRLELQADFYAGVWAHHAHKNWKILEPGDIEEALNAASVIGDDAIQKRARGYVVPESFTHGSSAQRVRWFRKGLETGDMSQGDTFGAKNL